MRVCVEGGVTEGGGSQEYFERGGCDEGVCCVEGGVSGDFERGGIGS